GGSHCAVRDPPGHLPHTFHGASGQGIRSQRGCSRFASGDYRAARGDREDGLEQARAWNETKAFAVGVEAQLDRPGGGADQVWLVDLALAGTVRLHLAVADGHDKASRARDPALDLPGQFPPGWELAKIESGDGEIEGETGEIRRAKIEISRGVDPAA